MHPEKPRQESSIEEQEKPKLIGRLTLLRHGQTEYTNVYPDLTEEGQETVRKSAEQIVLNLKEDEETVIVASEKPRAQGTAGLIKEALQHDKEVRTVSGITSMSMRDQKRGLRMISELLAEGGVPAVDYAYTHDPRFDDAEIWEPRSEIQKRFLSNLEHAIRVFKRIAKHKELLRPHLIAVTHFEVLSPFLQKVFNFKHPEEPTLKNAEPVEVLVKDPSKESDNSEVVFLEVNFRGKTKTIGFNRRERVLFSLESI